MRFLNEEKMFLKGRFEGESLDEVADAEPEYLKYLLDEASLEADERESIEALLN